jgi:NADH:ubiquinone oxidoreductase subunit 5 (subunit L)/multisubunit Na+/H+ antiporter MnhA subunit
MEGPTPVSALIHAATMVTAGVFLIIRCSALFEFSPKVLLFIAVIGSITAIFASLVGLVQNDVKKTIAYSTCSQLGYMVFSCGLSNYMGGGFHLVNHAFFKALLFLSAGALIHSMGGDQDMRKYGALINLLPLTYVLFLIGSLALIGFPFLSGFYSKDMLIASAYYNKNVFVFNLGVLSTFFTHLGYYF